MFRLLAVFFCLCLSWQASATNLTISAAASLSNAFGELAPLFEAQHPDIKVQLNFGASGALLQQIAKGAPVDIFASADQETMNQAQARNLVKADARRNFVTNSLVLIVPAGAKTAPATLNDLLQTRYRRIAIGLPASVPVGRYTKHVLDKAQLWADIEPRMISAQSVRQALDYVARGEVDAGFVYATDAALMPDKVKVAFIVPTDQPILYPIAPVAASAHLADAQKFIAFINSDPAQNVLAKYGFGRL